MLVSRGGAPTSALIARGSDYAGSFSHLACVEYGWQVTRRGPAGLRPQHGAPKTTTWKTRAPGGAPEFQPGPCQDPTRAPYCPPVRTHRAANTSEEHTPG